jgi:hypothetical protein
MDEPQTKELADRLREQREHLSAVECRSAAVISRARQAVTRSREARQHAASLFARTRATWRGPILVEAHLWKAPRAPMSRPANSALHLCGGSRLWTMKARSFRLPWQDASPTSRRERDAMAGYAKFGPLSGPLRSDAGYCGIGVYPDRRGRTPIGTALVAGQDEDGRALWRLTIDTIELPGSWVVVDREFRPAREDRC